ncbi:hypothetical protein GOBAR_AA21824 [Gossypium barbadense]|uniref:Protein kinase domain-containing protein n=1 Tax=Gossypium barbadense TaxID=3634 RepID=A0A2P5X680_GOSBA|nr:hypothetical protein GOBAR_AA21824 [Gossypium barbadense]
MENPNGNGKFSPIESENNKNKSSPAKAVSPSPSSVGNVPYSTARLSYSQFTYSIPLTSGPKFIRLHFYPTSYLSFNDPSKKAFFSVQAGPFTFLRNFNASLHAVPNVPLIKEFCTNVEGQRLNLTFTPSPDITHSYDFINAIEVVSMPINLYYTPEIDDDGVPFLGQAQGSLYTLGNNTALEMMYRVKVGGREIPPGEDTGMFWGWLKDDAYLTIAKPSALPVNTSINLTFNSIPSYSAPRDVYITVRTMGMNKTQNDNYYLTWEFPVDSGFNYFVRNCSKCYILEWWKWDSSISGLCGVNRKERKSKMRVRDTDSSKGILQWSQFSSKGEGVPVKESTKCGSSSLPSDLCRHFSLSEIKRATNNFDNVFIIGVGGFGNVYKGFIYGGATQVAIKQLNPESQQAAHEFRTEIEMLSQLRHLHLVSLIGYCNDRGEMILVYDYMANGTLRDHLYNTTNPPHPWKQQIEVCLGAAQGLQYLHSGAKHTINHRDVKTTNILLDEKWVAKVSDFGLSRISPTNMSQTHVSTVVKGSFRYLDPEHSRCGQLTEKSDVYSFGVVLCEILCARPGIHRSAENARVNLVARVQECHRNGTLYNMIDPFLKGKIVAECLKKFTEVVMSSLHDDGIERPLMDAVLWGLQFALQLQEIADEGLKPNAIAGIEEDIDEESPIIAYAMEDESGEVFSSIGDHVMNSRSTTSFSLTSDEQIFMGKGSDKHLSKAVFFEIRDQQGR